MIEDIYTVNDYIQNKIRGPEIIKEAKETITLSSIANKTLRNELWKESLKVN